MPRSGVDCNGSAPRDGFASQYDSYGQGETGVDPFPPMSSIRVARNNFV